MGRILLGLTALFGGLLTAATAPDLERPRAGQTVEVLVQYAHQPSSQDYRRVTDRLGKVRAVFENISVAHYDVTEEALADLEANPSVVSISPNRRVTANLDHVMAVTNVGKLQQYYGSINRAKALGISIAIIDSGINEWHPDLAAWATTNPRLVTARRLSPRTHTAEMTTVMALT